MTGFLLRLKGLTWNKLNFPFSFQDKSWKNAFRWENKFRRKIVQYFKQYFIWQAGDRGSKDPSLQKLQDCNNYFWHKVNTFLFFLFLEGGWKENKVNTESFVKIMAKVVQNSSPIETLVKHHIRIWNITISTKLVSMIKCMVFIAARNIFGTREINRIGPARALCLWPLFSDW